MTILLIAPYPWEIYIDLALGETRVWANNIARTKSLQAGSLVLPDQRTTIQELNPKARPYYCDMDQ